MTTELQTIAGLLRNKKDSKLSALSCLAIAFLLCFGIACNGKKELTLIHTALTSEKWCKEVGSGILHERYVYTFLTNGTYKACVYNEFGIRPMNGTWRTTRDKNGKIHLLLQNEEAYYYWLWQDSIIRYNRKDDVLVISGPHYKTEEYLKRVPAPHTRGPCGKRPPPSRRVHQRPWSPPSPGANCRPSH